MNLSKRKYTAKEVEKILSDNSFEYESKLNNQKERIAFLLGENKKLSTALDEYKEKDALISSTLISAKEKASEIEATALIKYSLVVESLKKFSADWNAYFEFLKEKYPNYATIQKVVGLKKTLDETLSENNAEKTVGIMDEKLSSVTDKIMYNPKERLNDLIAATGDSGFNIDEVLNPGKLELEDLCKELGLME